MANGPVFVKPEDKEEKKFEITQEMINQEAEENKEALVPSNFTPIKLLSNGRVKGVPTTLHFRCFTCSESLALSKKNDNKEKVIIKTLQDMCWEKDVDIGELPQQDISGIIMSLMGTYTTPNLEDYAVINPDLEGDELMDDSNWELVNIPFSSMDVRYLGTDDNDQEIEPAIKVPFTVSDGVNKYKMKLPSLGDIINSREFVKTFFKKDIEKFAPFAAQLERLKANNKTDEDAEKMANYLGKHLKEVEEYRELQDAMVTLSAEVLLALQIVEFNGNPLNSATEQWDIYKDVPNGVITKYNEITKKYDFGIKPEVEVFMPSLNKKVVRPFRFDWAFLSDSLNKSGVSSSITVEFE